MNYNIKFEAGHKYHVYNRAVGNELLFFNERNYRYFMDQYHKYLDPYIDTLVYCLLPNHFHLLIEVRQDIETNELQRAFRKFFISYSQAINKQESRKGSLFIKPYKRKKIDSDEYLSTIVAYIHLNPWLHNPKRAFKEYKWSSYRDYFSQKNSRLKYDIVLDWFGGIEGFREFHQSSEEFKKIRDFRLE